MSSAAAAFPRNKTLKSDRLTSCSIGSGIRFGAIRRSRSSFPWRFGYYFGSFTYKGLGLGAVTATLIAAVIIGQLDIKISGPLKPFFFLMFLFAIGYGVGPQFVRGIAQDGIPQALFAVVVCFFCLGPPIWARSWRAMTSDRLPGSTPDRRRSRRRWVWRPTRSTGSACRPRKTKKILDAMPVAYASPTSSERSARRIVLALLGPALLGIDLEAACKRYEEKHGGKKEAGVPARPGTSSSCARFAWEGGTVVGKTVQEAEALLPEQRVFIDGFGVATRSWMRRPIPLSTRGTSWQWPAGARCW